MRFVFHLINIILFKASLAIRQFNEEYPGVTVCESTMTTDFSYSMPASYMYLKAQFGGNHKCTHVEGNIIIQNIWLDSTEDRFNMSFLESIIEVSGMVFMMNNSINTLILPNLRVIRGQSSILINRTPVSLYINLLNENQSQYAILPSLRVISNYSVYFKTAVPHKYLPRSIKWDELFENPEQQKILSSDMYSSAEPFPCHWSCPSFELSASSVNSSNHCWSSNPSHCQKQTKCISKQNAKDCQWCYFKMRGKEKEESCCSTQCSGGCNGRKQSDCAVCKTYVNGSKCVESCPPEFIPKLGKNIPNPEYKLRVGFMCANSCPVNLLQQGDGCIYSCTTPDFYRVDNNTCLPCLNSSICAGKECRIDHFQNSDDKEEFYMTKEILKNFTDCENVIGEFHFTEKSFDKNYGGITTPMLYKHLKNVQFITGDLMIDGTNITLRNLTFLQNLKEIRHQLTDSGTAALNIMHTDLEFLGLHRLRHIYGNFEEHFNPNLCYLNTLNWTGNILRSNQFSPIYKSCDRTCHSQCDQGCWGPTSDMCFNCKNFRAGYNCVDMCEYEPGFYTNNSTIKTDPFQYDNGICQSCHFLCLKNCTGPNPENCVGGCRNFIENNICVKNCSAKYFPDGNICVPCNENCIMRKNEPLCTGNGSYIGRGGCSFCNKLIDKGNGTYNCYKNACPVGYYIENNYKLKEIQVCRPCLDPCEECSGNSTSRSDCSKCNGYWSGDRCVKQCFPAAQNLSISDKCPYCNDDCADECHSTHNHTFFCSICNNFKRFYTNMDSKLYQCMSNCPPTHKYTYKEEDSKDILCVTKSEWDKYMQVPIQKYIPKWTFLIVSAIMITLFFVSLIIVLYLKKINKKESLKYLKAIYSNIHEPDSKIILLNKKSIPNMNRLLLIPTTDLIFNINDKPLGSGAFGAVYQGIWKSSCDSQIKAETSTLDVAIKVIQTNKNIDINEILEEAKVMASVCHKHCLRLIGICLKYEMPCLVTAFVELGSLDKYLRKHKFTLSSYNLLSWGEQIANGMAYLEMRGIIHRDLATRNVLLNNLQLVQITDFGLAHILQNTEDNNEIIITGGQVPIRWLALETLMNGVYSHKTDVWAYGVTLWEIFTYGQRPYDDLDAREITTFLMQDNRLPQPDICSVNLYELIAKCWEENSNFRPSFEELMTTLSYFCRYPTFYLNIPNDPSLKVQKIGKQRLLSQYSYDFQIYPRHKDIYKQQSMDGTISTFVGDYQDDIVEPSLKRQSSGFSWNSNKNRGSQDIDKKLLMIRHHSAVSEDLEENENLFKTRLLDESDVEYLEPIKK